MFRFPPLGAISPRERQPGRSPLFQRGGRGNLATCDLPNDHERWGCLAGGCPAASYFSCVAKKSNQKKATPLPPKSPRLTHSHGRLANSPFGLRHRSPTSPVGMGETRRRQRGKGVTTRRFAPPLTEPRISALAGEAEGRRKLFERSEFFRRPGKVGILGVSTEAGRAFFGYFLCTSKESNAPPGAPGLPRHTHEQR